MEAKVAESINEFFSNYKEIEYKKGEIIIQPEEPLIYIYNIKSGYVKSYSINDNALELIINIYKPNSFFPITETLSGRTNTYYFEAITDAVLQRAPTREVHEYVKSDKEVLFDLTKRISSGLEGFMVRTQYLIRSNSKQKVASSLVLLARRFGKNIENQRIEILLPQTHEDISNLAGVSRETASIEIKKLEKDNLISVDNQIYIINDFEGLKETSTIYFENQALPYSF